MKAHRQGCRRKGCQLEPVTGMTGVTDRVRLRLSTRQKQTGLGPHPSASPKASSQRQPDKPDSLGLEPLAMGWSTPHR